MYDVELVTSKNQIDCGAACMAMLLKYYGTDIPLDDLIEECGCKIGGCTGKDLLRVGRAHNLDMTAFRMDAAELIRQDRPAIVWWSYTHWIVFCGKDDQGNVVIANPNRGRYGIDAESFEKLYSGISLWNGDPEDLPSRAEKPIAEGEYFYLGRKLCRAITPIAKGALLTLNTNYQVTSVENELTELNQ